MSALAELQRQFLADLAGDEPGPIASHVRPSGIAPSERMAVYRRSMRASQHDALAATYPVVRRLVADAFFREMARAYAVRSPSRSGDLHLFGSALAGFIAEYPHARDLAYLPDVARLEWACHESLHAAEAGPFDAAALARVPPARQGAIRLRLHPCARLVPSAHPVVALWEANQPGRDGTPDRREGADRALVWRDGAAVRMRSLDAAEWEFVRALARGAALEEAVDAMGEREAERLLEPLLARLALEGVVAGFDEGGA
jgi:hypothetical protein